MVVKIQSILFHFYHFKTCVTSSFVVILKHIWSVLHLSIEALTYFSRNIPGSKPEGFSTLRPRQNGRHFPDDIFKCIFLNENAWISIRISLKFVPKGPINNIPALVQIMAWRRPGDKPSSEPMMIILTTRICVTRPQWVNWRCPLNDYFIISMNSFISSSFSSSSPYSL